MPYEIREIDNQYCVFKVGSNDSLGCHESHSEAGRQIAAIEANENKQMGNFKVLNDNDWIGIYTNNFEDKEGEIIALKALQEFVDGANIGKYPMPELWFHHIEGTRHGIAKRLFQVGHFTIAYGEFDNPKDNEFVLAMKTWYDKQEFITMSHWFAYDAESFKDGVYHKIRTFEISTLPATREANPFTNFIMR